MTNQLQMPFGMVITWVLVIGVLILQLWPELPETNPGGLFLIIAGPPAYLAGEGFFTWLYSVTHRKAISHKRFSWLRVALILVSMTGFIGISVFVQTVLTN